MLQLLLPLSTQSSCLERNETQLQVIIYANMFLYAPILLEFLVFFSALCFLLRFTVFQKLILADQMQSYSMLQ